MSYSIPLLCLVMFLGTINAMDNPGSANYKPSIPVQPTFVSLQSSSNRMTMSDPTDQVEDVGQPVLTKARIDEMAYVLQQAPREAQMIIEHLKDPSYLEDDEYRSAIFVGEPGTGKTTTALAIAHTMMTDFGWKYKMLESGVFLGKFRNQTAIKLRQFLRSLVALKAPTVLVIDELNRLLEHASSEHHDTDTTSTVLWTFLDKQWGNQQFFFIGTMNDITKLPKPYKDRILFECIKFPAITDALKRAQTLRHYLVQGKTQLDNAITDQKLSELLANMGDCSGRMLKKLAGFMKRLYRKTEIQRSDALVITEALIRQAVAECINCKDTIQYDRTEETDAERQERLHAKSIEIQEKHFVQQQLRNDLFQTSSYTDYHYDGSEISWTKQKISDGSQALLVAVFDDTQRKLAKDVATRLVKCEEEQDRKKAQQNAAKAAAQKGWFSGWLG